MKGSANLRIRWGKAMGTTEIEGEITDNQAISLRLRMKRATFNRSISTPRKSCRILGHDTSRSKIESVQKLKIES